MDRTPIPINWSFKRKNLFPILYVTGTSSTSIVEPILLQQANVFMDTAISCNGKFLSEEPHFREKVAIQVSFSAIFRTEEDLKKYIENFPH